MSAIAAYCWPDTQITLASDGITYDAAGDVKGFVSKVLPIPELSCVIGNVGMGGFAGNVRDAITLGCRSFDQVIEMVADTAMTIHRMRVLADSREPHGTIILGGWSDRDQAFALYKVHTRPREYLAVDGALRVAPPGKAIRIDGGTYCSHASSAEALAAAGMRDGTIDGTELLSRHVCAARFDSNLAGGSDEFDGIPFLVGGFLQITTLRRDSVVIEVTHRWPDAVGTPFNPRAGELLPAAYR